jgi:predicted outer membrane repeat protein
MKKRTVLTVLLALAAFGAAYAQTTVQRSLYVSAKGDDNNNGRSETTPYKTLGKAVEAANAGVIKTITVIGTTIDGGGVYQSGADEILITGKADASEAERAVISGAVYVKGKVRFTHIRLGSINGDNDNWTIVTLGVGVVVTNLNPDQKYWRTGLGGVNSIGTLIMTDDATITDCKWGGVVIGRTVTMSDNASITNNGGTGIDATTVTLSGNASITNNGDRGISGRSDASTVTMSGNTKVSNNKGIGVYCSTLTMSENTEISRNVNASTDYYNRDGGGAYVWSLTMSGNAKIINNSTKGNGGGVFLNNNYYSTISISVSGNALISGNTAKNGGGIYLSSRTYTMEGGEISGNKAENGAGVYVSGGTFNHKGGTVSGNTAEYVGGGVYVKSGATYTAGGGTVSGNTAGDGGDDLFKQ